VNVPDRTAAMAEGRRADTARRRQHELTVTGIAGRAGVDRTFLYRHRDLLERLHSLDAQPTAGAGLATVTRASLHSDLLAAQHRVGRLAARVQQLERRLSELVGEQTWRDSGLGAPVDIDQLNQRIASAPSRGRRCPHPAGRANRGAGRCPAGQPRAHGARQLASIFAVNVPGHVHHSCCTRRSGSATALPAQTRQRHVHDRRLPQEKRLHSSLGGLTPVEYRAQWVAEHPKPGTPDPSPTLPTPLWPS
jgi:hypothetical protein